MREATVQALTITGANIRVGDSISVGGIPVSVVDVRDVAPDRKRVEFCDGNTFVLGRRQTISVVRTVRAVARPRTGRRPGDKRPRAGGVR